MKKTKTRFLGFLKLTTLLFISTSITNCQKDSIETKSIESLNDSDYNFKKGILAFENKQSFTQLISDFKNNEKEFNKHVNRLSNKNSEEFITLTPNYDIKNEDAIKTYIQRKNKEYTSNAKSYQKVGLSTTINNIDDEDDFIADPHFAALLNKDREIIVGDILYKYTPFGMFSTNVENKEELNNTINNFTPDFNSYEGGITIDLGNEISYFPQDYTSKNSMDEKYVYPSARLSVDNIYEDRSGIDNIGSNGPIGEIGDDGSGNSSGSSNSSSSNSSSNTYPAPSISTFPLCNNLNKTLLNSIVGPSVTCEQYWESRKRVKTKVWNQNYGIYSSIGISVRSQSRKLRIWWANKTDELILGYNTFTFDYPWDNQLKPSILGTFISANKYTYKYKGHTVNQQGVPILSGGNLWNTSIFPIKNVNDDWLNIQVHLPIYNNNIGTTVSTKDINSFAESLLKTAINSQISELKKLNKDTPTAIEILMAKKIRFIHHNWKRHKTDAAKIIEVFDWNTGQITISGTPGGGSGSGPRPDFPNLNAKSYNLVLGDVYGIARRGTIWKGSRIEYKED